MNKLRIATTVFAVLILTGCDSSFEYVGYYYPDVSKKDEKNTWDINIGFHTLEECRTWANEKIKNNPNSDYDCAYMCPYEKPSRIDLCEKLEK